MWIVAKERLASFRRDSRVLAAMRTSVVIALALGGAQAFHSSAPTRHATKLHAYVPSGMSPEEYAKLKKRVRCRVR